MFKRIPMCILILLLIGIFHIGEIQNSAQIVPPTRPGMPPEPGPFTDLVFEVAVPSSVLSLEPIPVVLRQKNLTDKPVWGYSSLDLSTTASVFVKKVGAENRVSIDTSAMSKFIQYANVLVAPGSVLETKAWLPLGLDTYFPTNGLYELKVVVASPDRTSFVDSNLATFDIRNPVGTDLLAYNLIKSSSFKNYLFSGVEFREVEPILLQLSTLYPNTRYGQCASFVLGEVYYYRRDYLQALTYLVRLEGSQDFVYSNRVGRYLSEIRRTISTQTGTEKHPLPKPQ